MSLFTLLVFGVAPAWQTGKVNAQAAFQQAGRSNTAKGQRILQRFLVSIEVGLCFVLVAGSALLLQSLWHLENDHLGFQPDHLVSIDLGLTGTKFEKNRHESLLEELRQKIRNIPGTSELSLSGCTPPAGAEMWVTFSRSDRPLPEPFHRGDGVQVCSTDANYFRTLGAPILLGRSFTPDEVWRGRPVAIINQEAQRAYFPGENPLGKLIGGDPWLTVVGVVADSKNQGLQQPAAPAMYKADLHLADRTSLPLLVRTVADPKAFEGIFGSEIRALDPGLFAQVRTVEQQISKSTAGQRFNAVLITFFGALALVTALVGVYGVLALAVSQRTQELGIRMALGATPRQVLSMVMVESGRLLGAGLLLGMAGSFLLARFLANLLYGLRPDDLRTYIWTVLGLSSAAFLASLLPARRAAIVDPMKALRHD
jgi:predicted permease